MRRPWISSVVSRVSQTPIARKSRHDRHRRRRDERFAEEPQVTAMSLTEEPNFLGRPSSYVDIPTRAE
jgi:hypothetical protein